MKVWGRTDIGKKREENQDSYIVLHDPVRDLALLIVCDGIGGAKAGRIASGIATETFADIIWDKLAPELSSVDIKTLMREAVREANRQVFNRSADDPKCEGMGTTLVAAISIGGRTVLVNVGDSRAYLIGQSGIVRLTRDHSVVEDMVIQGDITREEARSHPNKNYITRAVGAERELECDLYECELETGDRLLLCTDGLTDAAEDKEILDEILKTSGDPSARLIDAANERGGRDNITAVMLEV